MKKINDNFIVNNLLKMHNKNTHLWGVESVKSVNDNSMVIWLEFYIFIYTQMPLNHLPANLPASS